MSDGVLGSPALVARLNRINRYLSVLYSSAASERRRIHRLKLRGRDVRQALQLLQTQRRAIRALERVRRRMLVAVGKPQQTLAVPATLRGLCPIVTVVVA